VPADPTAPPRRLVLEPGDRRIVHGLPAGELRVQSVERSRGRPGAGEAANDTRVELGAERPTSLRLLGR